MTRAELEALAKVHPGVWIEQFAKILTKIKVWEQPVLNIFQARVVAAYLWCLKNGIAPRLVGLKPRQVGGTTIFAAIVYHHARRFVTKAVSIADILIRSSNLFRMLSGFAKYDTLDWGSGKRSETRTEITLDNGSEFVKRTADAPKSARSDTLTVVHASEVAFWKDTPGKSARDTAVALLNALADHVSTFAGMESTPNGAMGMFYDQWQAARWPEFDDYWKKYSTQPADEGSGWIRVFAAWFEFPEHSLVVDAGQARDIEATLTPREKAGIKSYGWTWGQIAWRRKTMKAKCLGDENRFDEEYPEDPQKCFLASGRPRFSTEGLAVLQVLSQSVVAERGLLTRQPNGATVFQGTDVNEAMVWMWERPRLGCRYLISVDTMTGESETQRTADSDCHSVLVLRAGYRDENGVHHKPMEVARIAPPCRLDNKPLAEQIDLLSRYYGRCLCVPEVNQAYGLLNPLRDRNVPIFRMVQYDKVRQAEVSFLGWQTNEDRRRDVIDHLSTAIREQAFETMDPHLVNQCQTFIITHSGRSEAQNQCKDDDVLSLAIGLFNLDAATLYEETEVERQLPPDIDRWQ